MFSSSFYAMPRNNANGSYVSRFLMTFQWRYHLAACPYRGSEGCRIEVLHIRPEVGVYDCFIKRFEPRTDVTRHRKPDVRPLHDGAVNPYSERNKLAWEATSSLVGAIDNDNHPQPRKTINRKERNGKWDTSLSGFVTSVNCFSLRESSFKWCNYEENKSQVTKGTRIVCFMVLCWMSY